MPYVIRRTAVVLAALAAVTTLTAPSAPTPTSTAGPPETFRGRAFDTCHTPPLPTMRAWKDASPFGAVGVYIGGRARACADQPHLDRSWVRKADRMGWKFLPLYVGSQSPCVRAPNKRRFAMPGTSPGERGAREGRDAVAAAGRLGMAERSAIYLDMEAYDNSDTSCALTTLRFVQGWNRAVRAAGYHPGFYSGAESGIAHMAGARRAGRPHLPEALWFADWHTPANLATRHLDSGSWQPHRRIHQYKGDVRATYGGKTLPVDRNLVDAPVAVVP